MYIKTALESHKHSSYDPCSLKRRYIAGKGMLITREGKDGDMNIEMKTTMKKTTTGIRRINIGASEINQRNELSSAEKMGLSGYLSFHLVRRKEVLRSTD